MSAHITVAVGPSASAGILLGKGIHFTAGTRRALPVSNSCLMDSAEGIVREEARPAQCGTVVRSAGDCPLRGQARIFPEHKSGKRLVATLQLQARQWLMLPYRRHA